MGLLNKIYCVMFKQLLQIVCATLLMLPMSFIDLGAQGVEQNYGWDQGFYFQVLDDGVSAMIIAPESGQYDGNKVIPKTVSNDYGTYTVTEIGAAFQYCNELISVSIPETVVKISAEAFIGSSSLVRLELRGGVASIGNAAFAKTNIQELILGENVTSIKNLKIDPLTINTAAMTPPECDENSFMSYDADLTVPSGALDAYRSAPIWENFFKVESLTLSESILELSLGSSMTLEAIMQAHNLDYSCIEWSTSDESVATVVDGVVTALGVGECDITVSCQDKSATCHVVVRPILPTSIELDVHNVTMNLGEKTLVVATILPENTTDKTVVWTSSDESIAVVENGVIMAVGVGECIITANCQGLTDHCRVQVLPILPASVELNTHEAEMTIGETLTLEATVMPENTTEKTLVWSSSDETVATVVDGVVTAVGIGSCDITVSCQGVSDVCHVVVNPRQEYTITLDKEVVSVRVNESAELVPVVEPEFVALKVISSDSTVVTGRVVEDKVEIDANGIGFAYVIVEAESEISTPDTCAVVVYTDRGDSNGDGEVSISDVTSLIDFLLAGYFPEKYFQYTDVDGDDRISVSDVTLLIDGLIAGGLVYPDSVVLSQQKADMACGETLQLVVDLNPANVTSNAISWISSQPAVASVQQGLVKALSIGECDIIARCMGEMDTCHIVITEVFPEAVALNKESVTLQLGESVTLQANVLPENVTNPALEWSTSDAQVATVNDGIVMATGIGECDIVVTCQDKQAICHVIVTEVYPEAVTLSQVNVSLQLGASVTLQANVLPDNVTNPAIEWESTDAQVATVTNGVVKAVGIGECDIVATCQNVQAICHVTVTEVYPVAVTLTQTTATLLPGQKMTLKATVTPANVTNPSIVWSTSSAAVATVNNGVVVAVAPGECDIIAKCQDKQGVCHIVVSSPEPTSIVLSQEKVTLNAGSTVLLKATVLPENATDKTVTWTTSNAQVATVSNGLVTAVAKGECDIIAKCKNVSATCHVSVVEENPGGDDENVITVNGVSFTMVPVEGGTFRMGAIITAPGAYTFEKPDHDVTLSDYKIGQTQVTQELWKAVMGSNSNPSRFEGDQHPVEQVSWDDCQAFIAKLNELTGMNFRLPTEAEWEYAAIGGKKSNGTMFSGSASITEVGWCTLNSNSTTHDVATLAPNELGIYDMTGNVNEWCYDWYSRYSSAAQTNPSGPTTGTAKVYRGGSWDDGARLCRVTYRYSRELGYKASTIGFRLAL